MKADRVRLLNQKLPMMKMMIPDADPLLVLLPHDETRRLTHELSTYHHVNTEFTLRYHGPYFMDARMTRLNPTTTTRRVKRLELPAQSSHPTVGPNFLNADWLATPSGIT